MKNSNARHVPKYEINLWSGKAHPYCVVIPVINEGQRIKSLLTKMYNLGIHEVADIIIVDGGSKDGSLEQEGLKSLRVAGLITKTDSGKLSAQLRCAYDFVLNKGYEGIITIDGNDKDDPAPIPNFIQKLKEGYDFIQASQFLPGGVAVNTPLVRDLAVRFIHAPALSCASGFKWTDTTQGFRGYSASMLLSPRINIFRKDFDVYELLAYLSYAAPRQGFKCIEVPTSRIYPEGEVPTKISSVRGNFDLLKTLYRVCTGHYGE